MKLNTNKLMIAALALCGTCFLSCEKEEAGGSSSGNAKKKFEFKEISVGSIDAKIRLKYTTNLNVWGVSALVSRDSLLLSNLKLGEEYHTEGIYRSSIYNPREENNINIYRLQPGEKYYYRFEAINDYPDYFDIDVRYYMDETTRSFTTTKDVDIKMYKYDSDCHSIFFSPSISLLETCPESNKVIDVYYSSRLELMSLDSIKKASKRPIVFKDTKSLPDSVFYINGLEQDTKYYIRMALRNDTAMKCVSDIITISTQKPMYMTIMVDLGLSVKWADRNLGAYHEGDFGASFAWGETSTKKEYTKDNYFINESDWETSADPLWTPGKDGILKTNIAGDINYDAATVHLGKGWRMPTEKEFIELHDKCTKTWCKQDGVVGVLFTAKNGNSIFIPFGWISIINIDETELWLDDYRGEGVIYLEDGMSYEEEKYWVSPGPRSKSVNKVQITSLHRDDNPKNRYMGKKIRPVYVGE